MVNKCNLIYSIFNSDVIISTRHILNAIQGYTVVDKADVLSRQDMLDWFKTSNQSMYDIPAFEAWKFTNPVTGEKWYVTNIFLAHGNKDDAVNILAFYYAGFLLLTTISTYINYKSIFSSVSDIKIVYSLGALSTPHSVISNYSINADKIKLPYVV